MASKKISQLTPVTPLLTDLVPLDRPTTGAGAPVTGHATLADIQAAIGGGGGSGNEYWFVDDGVATRPPGVILTTGSVEITGSLAQGFSNQTIGNYVHAEGYNTIADGIASHAEGWGSATQIRGYSVLTIAPDGDDPTLAVFTLDASYGDITGDLINAFNFNSKIITDGNKSNLSDRRVYEYISTNWDLTNTHVTCSNPYDMDPIGFPYTGSILASLAPLQYQLTFSFPPDQFITGTISHAEGIESISIGSGSHAEGFRTLAIGTHKDAASFSISQRFGAHSEGIFTIAYGNSSHSEGESTIALGNQSHSEGIYTIASGNISHAEGDSTHARGYASHSEGAYTIASGDYSHAEGISTTASGNSSHAEGDNTTASGEASHAEGASGGGGSLEASGHASHAEGYNTKAVGEYSHAEGEGTYAGYLGYEYDNAYEDPFIAGNYVFRIKDSYLDVTGEFPGFNNEFIIEDTAGYHIYTYVSSNYDTLNTFITGTGVIPDLAGIITSLKTTLPAGADKSIFKNQHAEGYGTSAYADHSHVEGMYTLAAGSGSHAEGHGTIALNNFSHAEGLGTIASGSYQHVQGKFNLRNNDFSIFVIGNGTGPDDVDRSDVARVNLGTPGSGSFEVTGTVYATVGFSGSLTQLTDGRSYLVAGTDISITTASDGQVTIDYIGTGGGGGGAQYWDSLQDGAIYTSGSALFRGPAGSNTSPADFGTDVFFYVSGSIGSKDTAVTGTAVFGGDVVISGTLHGGSPLRIGTDLIVTGSLSRGSNAQASGIYSHAEGQETVASGSYSHAEGAYTIADGLTSHAEGWGSATHLRGFKVVSVDDDGADPSHGVFGLDSVYGDITADIWNAANITSRMVTDGDSEGGFIGDRRVYEFVGTNHEVTFNTTWITCSNPYGMNPQSQSPYAGSIIAFLAPLEWQLSNLTTPPDQAITGTISHAEGIESIAIGSGSHAEGFRTLAIGVSKDLTFSNLPGDATWGAHAEGLRTIAYGNASHAEGDNTLASGDASHAEGHGNTASEHASHAEGVGTMASGEASHAEGNSTIASGSFSHAEGYQTVASGSSSHSEGYQTVASGSYTHAEGQATLAVGEGSHAEGIGTVTHELAQASHAEGYGTLTLGIASHTEGYYTTGSGALSHAEGSGSIAFGIASHAEGVHTIASGSGQLTIGKYNLRNNDFSLFVIGDGTSDDNANRSDIVRVNSGTLPGSGSFEVTGTIRATLGFSGSLTQLTDGRSYLVAGTDISITSASDGQVTIGYIGTGGSTGGSINLTFNESVTGISPTVIGSIYLDAGSTIQTTSRAMIGGSVGVEIANLELRRFTGGALLASFYPPAGTLQNITVSGGPISVSVSDWYDLYLSESAGGTALAKGLRLDL